MKVLIIEDEAPAFRRIQKILEEIDPSIEIVDVLDSVQESVRWLRANTHPDLIFSDIQLSDGISFEIYDQVKITKPVIFTTAFDEYTLRAFKVNSIDYLLKPIKKEDLMNSLQKYGELKRGFADSGFDIATLVNQIKLGEKSFKNRFLVKLGEKMISVETKNIAYFQSIHKVVHLTTFEAKRFIVNQSLDELVGLLNPTDFFRANRQVLISFDSIETAHRYHKGKLLVKVVPPSPENILISTEKATEFKEWLDR